MGLWECGKLDRVFQVAVENPAVSGIIQAIVEKLWATCCPRLFHMSVRPRHFHSPAFSVFLAKALFFLPLNRARRLDKKYLR